MSYDLLLVYNMSPNIDSSIGEKVSMDSGKKIHSIYNISNLILPSIDSVSCGLVSRFMFSSIALYIAFLSWLSIFFSRAPRYMYLSETICCFYYLM